MTNPQAGSLRACCVAMSAFPGKGPSGTPRPRVRLPHWEASPTGCVHGCCRPVLVPPLQSLQALSSPRPMSLVLRAPPSWGGVSGWHLEAWLFLRLRLPKGPPYRGSVRRAGQPERVGAVDSGGRLHPLFCFDALVCEATEHVNVGDWMVTCQGAVSRSVSRGVLVCLP